MTFVTFQVYKLLASFAGSMGLFLGLSLFSVIEFLVLLFDLLALSFYKLWVWSNASRRQNKTKHIESFKEESPMSHKVKTLNCSESKRINVEHLVILDLETDHVPQNISVIERNGRQLLSEVDVFDNQNMNSRMRKLSNQDVEHMTRRSLGRSDKNIHKDSKTERSFKAEKATVKASRSYTELYHFLFPKSKPKS